MTDGDARQLGLRLIACEGFRWMPGMRVFAGSGEWSGFHRLGEIVRVPGGDPWPDLRDPATRGCALELVREKHGYITCADPDAFNNEDTPWCVWLSENAAVYGASEAEVLVAAMVADSHK